MAKMANEIRTYIVDAIKRITESTWRGREHTEEEIVQDIKNFLQEEEEENITKIEWEAILDQFPIGDLSGKFFQIKDSFIEKFGYGNKASATQTPEKEIKEEKEIIYKTTKDPLEQEKKLIEQHKEIRKRGIDKVTKLYNDVFRNRQTIPENNEIIDFIKNNSLEAKENRRTVIIALSEVIGLEKIRRIFDIIEKRGPYESKRELFEMWVKKQKKQ